jgi:hypothetical protein
MFTPQEISTMTADDIHKAVMARRAALGLKIRVLTPEGEQTLYPKDQATKQRWIAAARRKGCTVQEVV